MSVHEFHEHFVRRRVSTALKAAVVVGVFAGLYLAVVTISPDVPRSARAALEAVVGSPLRSYYPRLEADAALRLGNALVAAGDPQQARAHLERALELRTRYDDEKSPWLLEAKVALAACLVELHDRQRAAALIAQAQAIAHAHAELGPQFTTSLSRVSIRLASR